MWTAKQLLIQARDYQAVEEATSSPPHLHMYFMTIASDQIIKETLYRRPVKLCGLQSSFLRDTDLFSIPI